MKRQHDAPYKYRVVICASLHMRERGMLHVLVCQQKLIAKTNDIQSKRRPRRVNGNNWLAVCNRYRSPASSKKRA